MKKMKINNLLAMTVACVALMAFSACGNKKFHVNGNITEAKDSTLFLENLSLNGPVTVDSVKLDANGAFDFSAKATDAPEFYRLRIAGQIINISIDSTETVTVKAAYPTMASAYEVTGSANCAKIKELALMQQQLQGAINAVVANKNIGADSAGVVVEKLLYSYKDHVKRNYIFKEPMKAYSYFALFQTFVLGGRQNLIFDPRSSSDDVKVYGAVATSWDTFWPKAERGENLHNIALESMRNQRIVRNEQAVTQIDASKVREAGLIDLALTDNKGVTRRLSDLKGKVVFLDFHIFADKESAKRIMVLRDLYNKYHAQGLEIYQVSLDPNEHFWKTQTAALPWICVRDESGASAQTYNVQGVPSFFLIDRSSTLYKRAEQIRDLEAEIKSLL